MQITVATLLVLGAAGCGGDETATKTVTVTVPGTQTAATAATPSESESPDSSGADGKAESLGPPLPAGVVGIDGSYLLKSVNTESQGGYIRSKLAYYEERSNATTKCLAGGCSVTFRLGLESGGFKSYTLKADPAREGTYIGTAKGQADCVAAGGAPVPTRERLALRGGSVEDVEGRQVAGRLSIFVTTTAVRCGSEPAKSISLLRGPRQP